MSAATFTTQPRLGFAFQPVVWGILEKKQAYDLQLFHFSFFRMTMLPNTQLVQ